jgi:hypothetical protein
MAVPSRKDVSQMSRDLRQLTNDMARLAAVEIMNGLADAGPAWSGEFRDSWVAIPFGPSARSISGGSYPYQINDIPEYPLTVKEVARAKKYEIKNVAEYAAIALDIEPGEKFMRIGEPIKPIIESGTRSGGIRGAVSTDAEGRATSTAPQDWYFTYIQGGAMAQALQDGVQLAIKRKP